MATHAHVSWVKLAIPAQNGLEVRGFAVTRLNTYNTVPVRSVDPQHLELAKQARVVAIASPSAIKCDPCLFQ